MDSITWNDEKAACYEMITNYKKPKGQSQPKGTKSKHSLDSDRDNFN